MGEPATVRPALPVMDDVARSADPAVCPFLRREIAGTLFAPVGVPGNQQVCVAIGPTRPQSLRQQELVCLRVAHADCPRYLRGALATVPSSEQRRLPAMPRATLAAILVLVLSAGISFGFVVQRGGLAMPVVGDTAESQVAVVATATPGVTAPLTGGPVVVPAATPEPTSSSTLAPATPEPTPTPAPTAPPTATAVPTVEPTPRPTSRPTAAPTPASDRYALLEPCPDRRGCWVYTVRAGDNLYSIANYFGHSLDTIYQWNPQYPGTRLKAGAQVRMPPPTR